MTRIPPARLSSCRAELSGRASRPVAFFISTMATIILLFTVTNVMAHDWYSKISRCCNEQDCRPLFREDVQPTQSGYYVRELNVTVPYDDANTSPDDDYHVCTKQLYKDATPYQEIRRLSDPQSDQMNRSTLCFFAPDGGA